GQVRSPGLWAWPDATGEERERTGLGRRRGGIAPDRLRQAVAEVEVGDEVVRPPEAGVLEVLLERLERALGFVNLENARGRRAQPSSSFARDVRSFRTCQ